MTIDLQKIKFNYGCFISGNGDNFISEINTKRLEFKLVKDVFDNHDISLRVLVKNNGKKAIKMNSIVVGDFFLDCLPQSVLENAWTQSGFSGYRRITPTKRKRIILMRDQNVYSLKKDFGYMKDSQISEWYTQLVFENTALVVGAISIKDQYSQVFLKKENEGVRVRVTCQLDGLELFPGKTFQSEKIAFVVGGKESSLSKFADLVKAENKVKSLSKPIRGLCCAYYYQANYVDEKYILAQLKAIDGFPRKPQFDVIQIDGLPPPWGEWKESWERLFQNGLPYIVKEIEKRGYTAGFWIAPFVANTSSKLFKKHPEWFLKNDKLEHFEARFTSPIDFIPYLSFRALDPTHPEVQKYVSDIISTMASYGFKYIKTDFTYAQGFSGKFFKKVTRAQALREGFEVIKKAAGKHVLIQSGISQLSPLVGLIDYCRTGIDTLNPYFSKIPVVNKIVNEKMLNDNLRSSEARNFLHNKIWVNDPDCVVFRSGTGISKDLIERHKDFAVTHKTARWTGDNLARLSEKEKLDLIKFFY